MNPLSEARELQVSPCGEAIRYTSNLFDSICEEADELAVPHIFVMFNIVTPGKKDLRVMCTNWPLNWVTRYCTRDYLKIDPIVKQMLSADEPFSWNTLPPLSREEAVFMSDAARFGLVDGVSGPLHLRGHHNGIYTAASPDALDADRIAWASCYLSQRLIKLFVEVRDFYGPKNLDGISARQVEIAHLFHQGVPIGLIADQQNCSYNTISYHLDRLKSKLQVRSHRAACYKVVALGLSASPIDDLLRPVSGLATETLSTEHL